MTAYDIQFRPSEAWTGTANQAAGIGTKAGAGTGYREARNRTSCQEARRIAGYREPWRSKAGYNFLTTIREQGIFFNTTRDWEWHSTEFTVRSDCESTSNQDIRYERVTVKAPETSICLTRESGLKPLMKYEFEVRSRNAECVGKWSSVSKYIGMYIR